MKSCFHSVPRTDHELCDCYWHNLFFFLMQGVLVSRCKNKCYIFLVTERKTIFNTKIEPNMESQRGWSIFIGEGLILTIPDNPFKIGVFRLRVLLISDLSICWSGHLSILLSVVPFSQHWLITFFWFLHEVRFQKTIKCDGALSRRKLLLCSKWNKWWFFLGFKSMFFNFPHKSDAFEFLRKILIIPKMGECVILGPEINTFELFSKSVH